jgi:hypothetical protein
LQKDCIQMYNGTKIQHRHRFKQCLFKYPDLPKSIQNIIIDSKIINETGILNDTYINLDKLSFRIDDQDVLMRKQTLENITKKTYLELMLY